MTVLRERLDYDVVIVGGGPAGLATAIRIMQLMPQARTVVLEKGSAPGAHTLSGAIIDPRALEELFPDLGQRDIPLGQPVKADQFMMLTKRGALHIPTFLLPDCFRNRGNFIASLGDIVAWLAEQAEQLGVEVFSGFPATEVLYSGEGTVIGVATKEVGKDRDGRKTAAYQDGVELHAKYTVFAEGARGQLGRQLIEKFDLDKGRNAQSHALGIKEVWSVPPENHEPGLVIHTAGWPLTSDVYGGSFLYHSANHKISLGFVVGLDYANPHLSPYLEFQRFKSHPRIREFLKGGKRISYGARAITAGGLSSLPECVFPGGALVGCDAGFLNASRIKGSHAAIKTGMQCAEAIARALQDGRERDVLTEYPAAFASSWLHAELSRAKNFKLWFKKGRMTAMFMTGIEQWLLPRLGIQRPPWTLLNSKRDHEYLKLAVDSEPIHYPQPDGQVSFDLSSSLFLSNTNHSENQPAHLTLKDAHVPVQVNLAKFGGPEARYCPAGVYEFFERDGIHAFRINAQNCLHCKTCDIKDPTQNIIWMAPEGGGGPNYRSM